MFKRLKNITEREYRVVRDIAIGTAPSRLEAVVRGIYRIGSLAEYSIDEIVEMLELPRITVSRLVEDLYMLGVLDKNRLSGMKTNWKLNEEMLVVMETAGIYK